LLLPRFASFKLEPDSQNGFTGGATKPVSRGLDERADIKLGPDLLPARAGIFYAMVTRC
jgi:hypothetical protein